MIASTLEGGGASEASIKPQLGFDCLDPIEPSELGKILIFIYRKPSTRTLDPVPTK